MLRLILCASLLVLASCNDPIPTIEPQERCAVVLEEATEVGDETYFRGYCRCHLYQWTKENIGRITPSVNRPLDYCQDFFGFSAESTATIYEWQEAMRLWLVRRTTK